MTRIEIIRAIRNYAAGLGHDGITPVTTQPASHPALTRCLAQSVNWDDPDAESDSFADNLLRSVLWRALAMAADAAITADDDPERQMVIETAIDMVTKQRGGPEDDDALSLIEWSCGVAGANPAGLLRVMYILG